MKKQKKSSNDGKKIERDEKGRLLPGVVLNPLGKKVGTLDWSTKWDIFIDKVAKQNNITPDEVDEQLLAVAFKEAKNANYAFYKDIQDRKHGKATEKIIVDAKVGIKPFEVTDEQKEILDNL